ncbi:MAG: hypothetical protein RR501_09545 [Cloacibacillus sp.]
MSKRGSEPVSIPKETPLLRLTRAKKEMAASFVMRSAATSAQKKQKSESSFLFFIHSATRAAMNASSLPAAAKAPQNARSAPKSKMPAKVDFRIAFAYSLKEGKPASKDKKTPQRGVRVQKYGVPVGI